MVKHAFKLYKFAKKKSLELENYRKIVEEIQLYQSETDQEDVDLHQSTELMKSISSEMMKDREDHSGEQTPVK